MILQTLTRIIIIWSLTNGQLFIHTSLERLKKTMSLHFLDCRKNIFGHIHKKGYQKQENNMRSMCNECIVMYKKA